MTKYSNPCSCMENEEFLIASDQVAGYHATDYYRALSMGDILCRKGRILGMAQMVMRLAACEATKERGKQCRTKKDFEEVAFATSATIDGIMERLEEIKKATGEAIKKLEK